MLFWLVGPNADAADTQTVLRSSGAPSIAIGRTPHEVRDELCSDTFVAAR